MIDKSDTPEPRVSETYRELATETTPAHLDHKVLEAARTGARTRYGLARAWLRPLAWAATISLSFAFVLQLNLEDDAPAMDEAALPTDSVDSVPIRDSTPRDKLELRDSSGDAITKAKELNRRAVSQAPARSVPAPSAAILNDTAAAAARTVIAEGCDAEARASAATWYECSEALRQQGFVEAADAELEALQTEFPDFRAPVTN